MLLEFIKIHLKYEFSLPETIYVIRIRKADLPVTLTDKWTDSKCK